MNLSLLRRITCCSAASHETQSEQPRRMRQRRARACEQPRYSQASVARTDVAELDGFPLGALHDAVCPRRERLYKKLLRASSAPSVSFAHVRLSLRDEASPVASCACGTCGYAVAGHARLRAK